MNIFDSNGRKITLTQKHFLAEGGEGKLFADKSNVYKIYLDKKKIIPIEKIHELEALDSVNIVRPKGSIFDTRQKRIGFSMTRVNNPVPLARLFTTSYWNNNGVTLEKIMALVKEMQKTIGLIHSKGFLQVDGNEFNYMANKNLTKAYFIDVDSYQTPGFKATAIMPSIRDYTQDGFNESTDWFSFAIVAFQLMVGIHPFKGRHKCFKKGDFEGRIKAGISVLNNDVTFPSAVRDFSIIPKIYRDWFEALFEKGKRLEAPSGTIQITAVRKRRVIRSGNAVEIKQMAVFKEKIRQCHVINGQLVVVAGDVLTVGKRAYPLPENTQEVVIDNHGKPLFLEIFRERLWVVNNTGEKRIDSGLQCTQVFVVSNIAYVLHEEDVVEVKILELAGQLIVAPGIARKVLANATSLYDGMVYESVLGKSHLMIPVASGMMPVIKVTELDEYRVIDGRCEKGVAVINIATRAGEYKHARLRFSADFTSYEFDLYDEVAEPFNFTVLDKGVAVFIEQDGLMQIISTFPGNNSIRIVEDKQISSVMKLVNDGSRVLFVSDNKVYAMTLKTP